MPYDESNFRDDTEALIHKARAEGIHPLVIAKVLIQASDDAVVDARGLRNDPMHEPLGYDPDGTTDVAGPAERVPGLTPDDVSHEDDDD
jgi:hypothetical protein